MPKTADSTVLEDPTLEGAEVDRDLSFERVNIAVTGKRFRAMFMTPGVINYSDSPKGGQELLRKQTIDEFLNSLIGAPLTIGHVPTNLTREELVDRTNGVVDKVGYDVESGWHFCEGTVDSDNARDNIAKGWGVSVGMRAKEFGPGGLWLNNRYDRELKRIVFHHLALVAPGLKPRIDESEIRLNSTEKKTMNIPKWIRSVLTGDKKTETVSDLPLETRVDIGGGKTATIGEMIALERANACHAIGSDDYVEHEGVRYHCGTLIKRFKDSEAGRTAADASRMNGIERVCATDTPELKAARDAVFSAADGIKGLKDLLTAADAEVTRLNSLATATSEDKTKAATRATDAKAAYDAAFSKGGEACERFNSLVAAKAGKTDAEKETERLAAERTANEQKEAARKQEEARLNATRGAGIASFAILAGAADRGGAPVVFTPPSSGRDAKRALGRKLCGSGRFDKK